MCTSTFHCIFNIACLASVIFTIIALATPGWSESSVSSSTEAELGKNITWSNGLFTYSCDGGVNVDFGAILDGNNVLEDSGSCKFTWGDAPDWQKAVVALLILAVGAGTVALLWSCFMLMCGMCLCCCKSYFMYPIPVLCVAAAVCDMTAFGVYAVNEKITFNDAVDAAKAAGESIGSGDADNVLGYSSYISLVAAAAYVVSAILSCCVIKVGKVMPL